MKPPLINSPTLGWCLLIDNSTLEYIQTCPRSMDFYYNHKRQSSEKKSALNFGGAIHAGVAVRYQLENASGGNVSGSEVEELMLAACDKHLEQNPLELGGFRTADLARQLLRHYNTVHKAEPFSVLEKDDKPLVEFPFAFELMVSYLPAQIIYGDEWQKDDDGPVSVPVRWFYTGRIDLILNDGTAIFTCDHKTTSMMGDGFWMEQRVNPQHEGYCWAWWKATGTPPAGYIINAIRVRPPLKRDENGFSKRSTRKDVEDDDFQRDKVFVSLERLQEWEFNTKKMLAEYINFVTDDYFPAHKKWCIGKYGTCQYYDVCNLAAAERPTFLASGMFKDVTWSPLTKRDEPPPTTQTVDWENLMKEV